MASSGKKKTTMAKLARESRLRERRAAKQAKKDARKLAPAFDPDEPGEALDGLGEPGPTGVEEPAPEAVAQPLGDA